MKHTVSLRDTLPRPFVRTELPEIFFRKINHVMLDLKFKEKSMYPEYDNCKQETGTVEQKPLHQPTAAILERIAQVKKLMQYSNDEVQRAEENLSRKIGQNKLVQKQGKKDLNQLNRALKLVKGIR